MQARRIKLFYEFDFDIQHVKGKENKVAGALNKKSHVPVISTCKLDWKGRIHEAIVNDMFYLQAKEELQKGQISKKYEGFQLGEDILLVYKNRLYVPNNGYLRKVVMDELHQAPYSMQLGYQKTIIVTQNLCFWPSINKDIVVCISEC